MIAVLLFFLWLNHFVLFHLINIVPIRKHFLAKAGSLSGADSGEDLRSLLIKAGDILAPECFAHTLPRPTLSVSSTKRSHTKTTEGGASKKVGVTKMSHTVRVALEDKGRKLADYNLAKEQAGEFVKTLDKSKDKQK